LDERLYISYPDAQETENGLIYLIYDHCRTELGEILMAALREEDILAQNVHTQGAFFKTGDHKTGKTIYQPIIISQFVVKIPCS
jgi:hypothetical protein